jgi:hypothetical protein
VVSEVKYVQAEAEHAEVLIANMRADDERECIASGLTSQSAVLQSMGRSDFRQAVYFGGKLACIYGVLKNPRSTVLHPLYSAWVLTTPVVEKYPKTFFKESLRVTHELTKKYGTLTNYVDARYEKAIRWLLRIGFEFTGAPPGMGPTGVPFLQMIRRPWQEV